MISKLITSNQFRQQVLRSFTLHRDFKACLSLREAEQILVEREQQINKYGKTALLQFLNNYPLNYSYKTLNSPIKICLYPLRFQNLSIYEQQLRYSILGKLLEYVQISEKKIISDELQKLQQKFEQLIKVKPFDAVHAINFLHMQKENRNLKLFYHCLEAIRRTDYAILRTIFPKTLPILIRRLSINQWNVLRNFPSLLQFITFQYIPKDLIPIRQILIIEKISQMQLHLCMHMKIPPCIDYIVGHYYNLETSGKRIDVHQLTSVIKAYDYLPIHYNNTAFNALLNKVLQLAENQDIFIQNMPFRRMNEQQKEKILKVYFSKKNGLSQIVYSGNNPIVKTEIIRTGIPKQMLDQLQRMTVNNQKEYLSIIICSTILVEYNKGSLPILNKIATKITDATTTFMQTNRFSQLVKFFSTSNLLNLIFLKQKLSITRLDDLITRAKQDMLERSTREKDFKGIIFIETILQGVGLYHNSDIQQIRQILSTLIINFTKKQEKFYFEKYSDMINVLIKSEYLEEYRPAIKSILALLKPQDAPFFVEIFNRSPNKNMKMQAQIFNMVWQIDPSFNTMGRFMITSSYANFTSARGELLKNYRQVFQNLEPLLNIASVEKFTLSELSYILKFCKNFYFYISQFSRKILLLSIKQASSIDFSIDKGKGLLNFITEAIALKDVSNGGSDFNARIMGLVNKLCSAFPENKIYKIKHIEFMWLLGESANQDRIELLLNEIIDQLTYSPKQADILFMLLKLDSFGAIKLRKQLPIKFYNIIRDNIQTNQSIVTQILKEVSIPFREGQINLQDNSSSYIPLILIRCMQAIKSKQNFDFFFKIANYGNYIKSDQLVEISFKKLSYTNLYPSNIRKMINLLKFYRNIDISELSQRLLAEVVKNYYHLSGEIAEVLFSIHYLKDSINNNEYEYTKELLKKLQPKTLQSIKSSSKLLQRINQKSSIQQIFSILVYLWVSLKINHFQPNIIHHFKFMQANYQHLTKTKQHFHGITSDSLAYIMLVGIAYLKKNAPEELGEQTKKGFFKKNIEIGSIGGKMAEEKLMTVSKGYPIAAKKILQAKLIQQGLTERSMLNNEDLSFELNKNYKKIPVNAHIRKNGKQYIVIFVNEIFLNKKGNRKGRLTFTKNCIQLITDLQVILISQKEKPKFF